MNSMTELRASGRRRSTLTDDERQRCEVWTRVMGYHRPVASFNIGKKGEHSRAPLLQRGARRRIATAPAPPSGGSRRPCAAAATTRSRARAARRRLRSVHVDRLAGRARRGGVLPGLPLALRLLPQSASAAAARRRRATTSAAIARRGSRTRRGLLDAVVFSGGEPTAQAGAGGGDCARCARWASRSACTPAAHTRGGWLEVCARRRLDRPRRQGAACSTTKP